MGVVHRAEDLKLDRAVAIKFLPEEMGSDPRAVERFEREARAASSLDHPNICSIYEFGEHEGQPFLVMQLLHGETLRSRLAADSGTSPFGMVELLRFAIQIASGLEAAHEKGIIHRDIKPANIFLTNRGLAKILDFGLAKILERDETPPLAMEAQMPSSESAAPPLSLELSLSREGAAMGTAGYMSPEQVRGEKLDPRTDLFSFGLVLYEMATGHRTFSGQSAEVVRNAILHEDPPPAHELNPHVPPMLEKIINRALAKDRESRYQSATGLLADLRALKADLSPRHRTANVVRRRWKPLVAAAVLVVAVVATLLYFYWQARKPPVLAEKSTLVLADFENTTGDTVFDDSLRQALAFHLDQSPYLNVLSERKMVSVLRQMERPPEQRVTPDVAAEVCQRTRSQAVLAGSIAQASSSYRLTLRALSCQTGHALAVVETHARNRSEVLNAMNEAGDEMRKKLGESLASVNKFDQPLYEATTSSLEALKAFSKAREFGNPSENLAYMKRAVELDPNFAIGYAELGATYMNVGAGKLGMENIRKAYQLRERASQRERFYIEATYYGLLTRELDKAGQSCKEWAQNYPGDWRPHNALAIIYAQLGLLDKAADEMREVIRLAPDNPGAYGNLVGMLTPLGRLQDAQQAYEQAQAHGLDSPYLRQYKYLLAFLQGDAPGMQEQVQWAMGKPRVEDVLLSSEADTNAFYGRLKKAHDLTQRAMQSAVRAGGDETPAAVKAAEALREAEIGNSKGAVAAAQEALFLHSTHDVKTAAALALARAGKIAQAQELAESLNQEFPLDTMLQNYALPVIQAAIQLQQDRSLQAVETLEVSRPYELGQGALNFLYPAYLRGEAYLKAGRGESAAAEFQKVLDHPGVMANFITGALARLQLGRAQAMMGDKAAARKSYQDFLTLWKDADPDLPFYRQAKAEYAKLR